MVATVDILTGKKRVFSAFNSNLATRRGQKHSRKDATCAATAADDLEVSRFRRAVILGFLILSSIFIMQPVAFAAKSSAPDKVQKAVAMPFGAFGSLEFKTNASAGLGEWRKFQKRSQAERKIYINCASSPANCPKQLLSWGMQLKHWQTLSGLGQINAVNAWINDKVLYMEDIDAFGVTDRWTTLLDTMNGRGDCEDYALAKYETLRSLGFAEDSLRLVVVKDTRKKIGHAVLTVAFDGGLYVLDNQSRRAVRHETINHYAPVFSINASGRWINIATRKIRKQYEFALGPDGDPALAPKPAAETRVAQLLDNAVGTILKPTILDFDLSVEPAAPASYKLQLGTGARELP